MGSRRDDFVVIGTVLPYKEVDDDALYEYLLDDYEWRTACRGDFIIVADGMNCEYVVAGRLIEHPDENGFPVLELDPSDSLVEDVEDWVESTFGVQKPASVVVFSHWH